MSQSCCKPKEVPKLKKVLILIPTADKVEARSLKAAYAQDYGNVEVLISIRKPSQLHDDQTKNFHMNIREHKNHMRELALKTDADYFMWLDSDVELPKYAVTKLMLQLEQPAFDPRMWAQIRKRYPGRDITPKKKHIMGGWYQLKKTNFYNAGKFYADNCIASLPYPQPSVVEVDKIDLGCVIISREVFQKIKLRDGNVILNEHFGGCECLMFANDAVKLGYSLYIDGAVICKHNWKGKWLWQLQTLLSLPIRLVIHWYMLKAQRSSQTKLSTTPQPSKANCQKRKKQSRSGKTSYKSPRGRTS